jgi:hypothetical protein
MAIAAWVFVSSLAGANDQYWFCLGDQTTGPVGWASYIQHSTGDLGIYSFGNTAPTTAAAVPVNTWTRVLCGWTSANNFSFFVNGVFAASVSGMTFSTPSAFYTLGNLKQAAAFSTSGLVGSLAQASIYPTANNGVVYTAYDMSVLAWSDYVAHAH